MSLKPGNVYCMDALDGLRMLPDGSIDMMLTSPPYDNLRTYNGYSFDFEGIARESYRTLKDGGVLVWVVRDAFSDGSESLTSFRQALYFREIGFSMHQRIVWVKEGLPTKRPKAYLPDFEDVFVFSKGEPATFNGLTRKNKNAGQINRTGRSGKNGFSFGHGLRLTPEESLLTNVWVIGVGGGKTTKDDIQHPAMFPEELARRHILTWSNPGDVVCDPFSGSGTTWKECMKADRQFIGFEISEEYCNLSRRRIANWRRDSDIEVAPGVTQMGLFA